MNCCEISKMYDNEHKAIQEANEVFKYQPDPISLISVIGVVTTLLILVALFS